MYKEFLPLLIALVLFIKILIINTEPEFLRKSKQLITTSTLDSKIIIIRANSVHNSKWITKSTYGDALLGSTVVLTDSSSTTNKTRFILDKSASEGRTTLYYLRPEANQELAFSFRNGRSLVLSNPSYFEGNSKLFFKWVVEYDEETSEIRFKTTESFPKCATITKNKDQEVQIVLKLCNYKSNDQLFFFDIV